MESPETINFSMEHLMPFLMGGIVALVVLFVLLALVRIWGVKMQTKSGACGGIDLEDLRRRRDAGEISQAEYEAVCASATGGADGSGPRQETPINHGGAEDGGSERSLVDGEAQ
ncbi:MAG: hypothetical protein AMK72_08885 [Planctomycetes bacterium SM23_25]|nr:MAG: hypothetical protein AMK72_08885 [Planctomycetes bacterium SM23_25]